MKALVPQTITIPAAAGGQSSILNVAARGKYFYCQQATTSFGLQFDAQIPTTCQTGFQIGGSFSRITFSNSNSISVTVTFYVSDEPITYVSNNQQQVQSSYTLGRGVVVLAAGASETYTGSNNGQKRKQFFVRNQDANLSIDILDASGNIFDVLPAGQPWTYETDGTFTLKNPNGAAVNVVVGETFYT